MRAKVLGIIDVLEEKGNQLKGLYSKPKQEVRLAKSYRKDYFERVKNNE